MAAGQNQCVKTNATIGTILGLSVTSPPMLEPMLVVGSGVHWKRTDLDFEKPMACVSRFFWTLGTRSQPLGRDVVGQRWLWIRLTPWVSVSRFWGLDRRGTGLGLGFVWALRF